MPSDYNMAKEKIYKCRYNHCKHETKDVLASEAVKDGNRYFHKDCYKTKEEINKIIELFAEYINPNVVFAVLRKVVNNIVFNRGVDSGLLLFGLNYYIANKITLNYPQGLYYVIQNKNVIKGYKEKKNKEYLIEQKKNLQKAEDDTEMVSSFTYKPNKQKSFADILR